mmetsp:Transcript_502/g.564  ORF Transcript_502/g.564 Transcript_502/m.564 type:complete len:107 (+) Transcript_502:69-389(+)
MRMCVGGVLMEVVHALPRQRLTGTLRKGGRCLAAAAILSDGGLSGRLHAGLSRRHHVHQDQLRVEHVKQENFSSKRKCSTTTSCCAAWPSCVCTYGHDRRARGHES